jgi:hypothetical protein
MLFVSASRFTLMRPPAICKMKAMKKRFTVHCWIVSTFLALLPIVAQGACRQALALGLDVSGSVSEGEYALQMKGVANALLARNVQQAFLAVPSAPVRLYVFIWSGSGGPLEILSWIEIADESDLIASAELLKDQYRHRFSSETRLGEAMLFGRNALETQSDCWRLTLDVSGDGKSNSGIKPTDLQLKTSLIDITINALVVGQGHVSFLAAEDQTNSDLVDYFSSNVIRGPGAFVEVATDYQDFENAMIRKLLKELQTLEMGYLATAP